MTDRELLELAAKAGGLVGYRYCDHWRGMAKWNDSDGGWFEIDTVWNPRRDDGDALRLAVKLGFINPGQWPNAGHLVLLQIENGAEGDWYEATRRAIVMAAAEIGRAMP